METNVKKSKGLRTQVLVRIILALLFLCLGFFLPARTIKYWEAWVYLAIIFICAFGVIIYFFKTDPDFLVRRMRVKEEVKEQKLIIKLGWFLFLPVFIIPGFDKHYGWSNVPLFLIISSDFFVLIGYLMVIRVFKENSYAYRVVEVESNQKVILTGPYSLVRHPMYTGILLMYGFTPLALGSYWALIGSFLLIFIIVARIFSEEKFLSENLDGYNEYLQKTKYRLIPHVW